jgi:glycosyltransferase involved in cell wall biosynthesis
MKMIPYGAKIAQCDDKTCADEVLGRHGLEKQKYLIFVGRLVPEKGIHNLIEAYNSINLAMPLVIVGDDRNDSEYRNTLMKQKSDRIRFLGFIYGKEYEYLLCNALLYVSASELEGTSPSLLAAMGAGVCAVVNGIEENLCTVGDAAFSYRANDNSDLAKTLEQLVNNPDSIHRMAKKGLELVRKKYAWSSVAEAYLNVFSGLIKDS